MRVIKTSMLIIVLTHVHLPGSTPKQSDIASCLPQSTQIPRSIWQQIIIPYIGIQNVTPSLHRLQGTLKSMTCIHKLPCTTITFTDSQCLFHGRGQFIKTFLNVPPENKKPFNVDDCEIAYSPDGSYMARGSNEYYVYIDNPRTKKNVVKFLHDTATVSHVAWNCKGNNLASSSFNKVRIWKPPNNLKIKEFNYDKHVTCLVFIDDDNLAAGLNDGNIVIRSTTQSKKASVLHDTLQRSITALASNKAGTHLASGSRQGIVILWRVADQSKTVSWQTKKRITALAFNPAGTHLATGDENGTVFLEDLHDPKYSITFHQTSPIRALAFNKMDNYLATASNDGAYFLDISGNYPITIEQFILLLLLEEYKVKCGKKKISLREFESEHRLRPNSCQELLAFENTLLHESVQMAFGIKNENHAAKKQEITEPSCCVIL